MWPTCPNACVNRPAGVDATADFQLAINDLLLGAPPNPAVLGGPLPVMPTLDPVIRPFSVPQPGEPGCPLCGVMNNVLVGQLEVGPDTTVTGIIVHVATSEGEDQIAVELASPEEPFEIPLPIDPAVTVEKALIEIAYAFDATPFVLMSDLFVEL